MHSSEADNLSPGGMLSLSRTKSSIGQVSLKEAHRAVRRPRAYRQCCRSYVRVKACSRSSTAHRHGIGAGPPSPQQNIIYPSFSISNAFPLGASRLWEDSDLDHFHCFSIGYLRAGVLLFSSFYAIRAASYIHGTSLSTLFRPHSNQPFDSTCPGHLLVTFATVLTPL